jgi:hypothetical protein
MNQKKRRKKKQTLTSPASGVLAPSRSAFQHAFVRVGQVAGGKVCFGLPVFGRATWWPLL